MAQQTDHGGEIWTTSPEIFRFGRSGPLLFRPGTLLFRVSTSAALAVARSARHSTVAERPHRHRPHRLLRVGGCARCAPTRRGAPRAAAGLESPHLARVGGEADRARRRASPRTQVRCEGGRALAPPSRRPLALQRLAGRSPCRHRLESKDVEPVARGTPPPARRPLRWASGAMCSLTSAPERRRIKRGAPRARARSRAWCSLVPRRARSWQLQAGRYSARGVGDGRCVSQGRIA